MFNSLQPHGLYSPWNSPGQNARVGSLSLLQQIFPTQESNPGLLHCRQILHQLSYQGSLEFGQVKTLNPTRPENDCQETPSATQNDLTPLAGMRRTSKKQGRSPAATRENVKSEAANHPNLHHREGNERLYQHMFPL